MRSKTSFFEPTLFRKNLTRFAPAWGLYTLCLVLGMLLLYSNGGIAKQYHFASNLMDLVQVLGGVNLVYGAVVAQLLFGDLYSSRMCYALHAMPVRRESLFYTNLASGFLFSLLPTLVMSLVSLPLLADSCFIDAWKLPLYVFAGAECNVCQQQTCGFSSLTASSVPSDFDSFNYFAHKNNLSSPLYSV